jgi:hypothetical protein
MLKDEIEKNDPSQLMLTYQIRDLGHETEIT